jgi:phage terminase large subunit-like protein
MATQSSLAGTLAALPDADRIAALSELSTSEYEALQFDWKFWARPNQLAPQISWATWLILAGRGWGKTRTGAEWVRDQIEFQGKRRFAFVGATSGDARDIMIEGESGILSVSPPWFRPRYLPSKRRLVWPNGAQATVYSADEPDRLRGPNHDAAWADELASWRYPAAWDMLLLGLRIGKHPQVCVTTTPKPVKHIKDLIKKKGVAITKGTTYENLANLAPQFREEILALYENTRLGRQEIFAEIIDDAPGALWHRDQIEKYRIARFNRDKLRKIVVGVDPEVSSKEESAETGIVVCGEGEDSEGYVIDDMTVRGTPHTWASQAVAAYHKYKANCIVAEINQGGEMVEYTIHTIDKDVPVETVHATRGKYTRAEPVASLAEKGKIHHIGLFAQLEDQLCQWTPGDASPDRLDAMVWGFTHLMVKVIHGGQKPLHGH